MYLRTVPALLARALLTATYRTCLWLIRACTMILPHSSHIQVTAVRPHGCSNRAKNFSRRVPTLFQGSFATFNGEKRSFGVFIEDLARRLLKAHFVRWLCSGNRAIKSAEMTFFCEYTLTTTLFPKSPR